MSLPRRILVLGGTGFVGSSLCERLVARDAGCRITVATRRLAHARTVQFLPTVDVAECDVHDDTQLLRLLAGQDAAINLIAILHGGAADFDNIHVQFARRLADACTRAGVGRVIHVSALGVAEDAPSLYLRSKARAEAAWKASPLAISVLRPSVIFGQGDRFLNLFAAVQAVLPVMPLACSEARFQPVWVEDVAEALVRCLERPETIGKVYECAGPEVHTLRELVQLAGRLSGNERRILALPDGVGRLQAMFMELLPGTPLMSRDNILSMRVPNVATGVVPGLDALGIDAAALEAVSSGYLAPGKGVERFNRWRAFRMQL